MIASMIFEIPMWLFFVLVCFIFVQKYTEPAVIIISVLRISSITRFIFNESVIGINYVSTT